MQKNSLSTWLRRLALIPAGFFTALWLLFGLGEVSGGDLSGAMHLAPALLMILLGVIAWKRPRSGGLVMLVAGAVILIAMLIFLPNPSGRLPGALLTGGPFLLSGFLFLLSRSGKPARAA